MSEEGSCPKCGTRMLKSFAHISGNAKYINFECEKCGHRDTKCMGVL